LKKVFIIAEAGVNHNGSIELAKRLIDEAKMAGVDAVKFQTFQADKLVSKHAKKAAYQNENTDTSETQYEMLRKLELDLETHKILIQYCNERNIMFLSTPFDNESIDLLDELGVEVFKIPSGEIDNIPYLTKVGAKGKKVILSTGMSGLSDIEFALDILKKNGTQDIVVLHCNTEYPTPMQDVNLMAMLTIKQAFKVEVGYSDHTLGIEIPIAAVALGASVIEKHFTLDKTLKGPDHRASLEPKELRDMVNAIRNIEKAMGDGIKKPTISELKNKEVVRKSIVASKSIRSGEIFTEENLTLKRPAEGLKASMWNVIIGRKANKDYIADEMIEL
jgi:N,N'-diacetyllegionaminate synthase